MCHGSKPTYPALTNDCNQDLVCEGISIVEWSVRIGALLEGFAHLCFMLNNSYGSFQVTDFLLDNYI